MWDDIVTSYIKPYTNELLPSTCMIVGSSISYEAVQNPAWEPWQIFCQGNSHCHKSTLPFQDGRRYSRKPTGGIILTSNPGVVSFRSDATVTDDGVSFTYKAGKSCLTVSEVGLKLPSSLKSGFPLVVHLQST